MTTEKDTETTISESTNEDSETTTTDDSDTATQNPEILDDSGEVHENGIPVTQQLVLLSAILILLLGSAFTPTIIAYFRDAADSTPAAPVQSETREHELDTSLDTSPIKPFSEISIQGASAYVWDVQGQRALYKKAPTKQLPLASVTKLMTALITYELLSEASQVTIDATAIAQDGDSGLLRGETFDRATLSDLVLMSSSNDGAYAMAVAAGGLLQSGDPANAFVHAMNIRAEELSLHDTYFKNPTGLDISEDEGGAYGSAKDMAFLMEHIILNQPDVLSSTQQETSRVYSQDGIYHDAVNTNYYIDQIPGLIGSKTGYTDLAGGNLVVAFDAGLNRPIIITVLGSTRHERFTDVITLVKESEKYVTQK